MSSNDPSRNPRFSQLDEAYAWLESHINHERQLGRVPYSERTFDLKFFRERMGRLGNPQRSIPSIHVAGTRGKGSTALVLEAILIASGLRTATFTSPHLNEYRERIRIDGRPIGGKDFLRHLAAIAAGSGEASRFESSFKTVFEHLTALFFMAAREASADWMVVETGLGGRLDATNVLDPGPAILTRIGLEHTHLLGEAIDAIAAEKAAILKPGGWAVVARQDRGGEAFGVFAARSNRTQAPLIRAEEACPLTGSRFTPSGMDLALRFEGRPLRLRLPLLGPFQVENVQSALAMAAELRKRGLIPRASRETLIEAIARVRPPGRMERQGPMGRGAELIVDGGHCPTAARAIAKAMEAHFGAEPAVALVGMMADKDHAGFFAELARWPGWRKVICYGGGLPRSETGVNLAARAAAYFPAVEAHEHLDTALESALESAEKGYRIVSAGSIFSLSAVISWRRQHARSTTPTPSTAQIQSAPDPAHPGKELRTL